MGRSRIAGRVNIRRDQDGRWSIRFSDVALENDGTWEIDRHIPSGSITGKLIVRES